MHSSTVMTLVQYLGSILLRRSQVVYRKARESRETLQLPQGHEMQLQISPLEIERGFPLHLAPLVLSELSEKKISCMQSSEKSRSRLSSTSEVGAFSSSCEEERCQQGCMH